MFLDPSELKQLTGRCRASAQIRALRAMGVVHKVNAAGKPVVLRPRKELPESDPQPRSEVAPGWEVILRASERQDRLRRGIASDGAPNGPSQLYRHYGADGDLLYVGISINAIARLSRHRTQAKWFALVRTVTIEPFPTREQALEAEARAIREERPSHNRSSGVTVWTFGLDSIS